MIRGRPRWLSVRGVAAFRSRSEGRHARVGLPRVGLVILSSFPLSYTAGQERTGWTTPLTCAARTGLGGTRWTNVLRLVIGRSSVRIRPGLQTAAQRALSGVAGRAAATAGSFLGLDHRARRRAAPTSLCWSPSDRSNARRWPCFVGPLRPTPGDIVEDGRFSGLRTGRAFARIQTRLRLRRPSDSAPNVMPSGIGLPGVV